MTNQPRPRSVWVEGYLKVVKIVVVCIKTNTMVKSASDYKLKIWLALVKVSKPLRMIVLAYRIFILWKAW